VPTQRDHEVRGIQREVDVLSEAARARDAGPDEGGRGPCARLHSAELDHVDGLDAGSGQARVEPFDERFHLGRLGHTDILSPVCDARDMAWTHADVNPEGGSVDLT
jgi:hypothetical protein